MVTAPFRLLAGAATAALVTGTLLTAPATAASQPSQPAARANYHVPKPGSCHLYSRKQAFGSSAPGTSVPCTEKHTTVTVAVRRLTGAVDWNNKLALQDKIGPKCERAKAEALGGNDKLRSMTAYEFVWFRPSRTEIKRGAKWLRCDLVLAGGKRLMPLRTDLKLTALTDAVARCYGDGLTVCARPHGLRAVGAFRLSGAHPDDQRARAAARRGCPRFVNGKFAYTWPALYAWKAGSRAMVCYDVTRR
jgi:hypothetical protein